MQNSGMFLFLDLEPREGSVFLIAGVSMERQVNFPIKLLKVCVKRNKRSKMNRNQGP